MNGETAFTLTLETEPSEEDLEIFSALREYNVAHVGESHAHGLILFLRDASGKAQGGLKGTISWEWLHITLLVLRKEWRGKGYGSRMLESAEQEAIRQGCRGVYLDTFSFQALPFYQKRGYEVFGTLDDYPPGHSCYFLKKFLMNSSGQTLSPRDSV